MKASEYLISPDKSKLDIQTIHDYLANRSYWAKGRSLEQVERSIKNSFCFGVYDSEEKQCGFARVVSDLSVFAYIMDVFILESYRGQGLGKMLVAHILNDETFKHVMRWNLDTLDAHALYRQFGFDKPRFPDRAMQKFK